MIDLFDLKRHQVLSNLTLSFRNTCIQTLSFIQVALENLNESDGLF